MRHSLVILAAALIGVGGMRATAPSGRGAEISPRTAPTPRLPNLFFAMNFAMHDARYGKPEAQAELLRELGYDGAIYLGPLAGLQDMFRAMDAAGRRVFTAAVSSYNISVDPGQSLPAHLKDAVRELKGRETLLAIQFVSKDYARGSPAGDARAVELGRELADYARPYGVKVAIYHHKDIWCERVDHAVRIAKQCRRDNLGVCFNLVHWLWTDPQGDLQSLVREARPHLFLVTINGSSPSGSIETLDRGAYDVGAFLRVFVDAGYKGPIGLQCVGIRGDPRENLTRSMEAWRKLSARLATPSHASTAVAQPFGETCPPNSQRKKPSEKGNRQ
jgi:sugar phosphate isomerase/epimerase